MHASPDAPPAPHTRRSVLAFAIALASILVALASIVGIDTRGEAREGLVIRGLLRGGSWILPERNGVLASKPPLYHWLAALLALPLGGADAVLRLPSALAAVALALLTFHLGAVMGSARRGWLAVGALLGCFLYWRAATEARVDMLFAACVSASLASFWEWYRTGRPGMRLACHVAAAAATLAKGPVGLVLPTLVIVVFCLRQGDNRTLRRLYRPDIVLLAMAPVISWYGLAVLAGGQRFVDRQLVAENLNRFVGRGAFVGDRAIRPLKLVGALLANLLPWNIALLLSRTVDGPHDRAATRFLHAWWMVVFAVFFVAASGKRGIYLLPMYPAVALLAARWLDRTVAAGDRRLPLLIVAFDLTVALVTQSARLREARANPLRPFAAEIARRAPSTLTAAPNVAENDVLVLAYLLDRPIGRAPLRCTPGQAWLVRADAAAPERVAGTRDTALALCPAAAAER